MPRNARFWWGAVKVTLRPGQSLTTEHAGRCDEGWSRECETLTYDLDDMAVRAERFSEGRDCDGYHSDYRVSVCPLADLAARFNDYNGLWQPAWRNEHSECRDQFAEAAGY